MKSKFKISAQRRSNSLHLRLMGEFDDMSLCDLIDVLKDNCTDTKDVFIHTSELEAVCISGIARDVFRRNISQFSDNSIQIQFTGESGNALMPGGVLMASRECVS